MRLSRYFLPTLKEAPSDAQIISHQLMLRAGLIRQEAAGIFEQFAKAYPEHVLTEQAMLRIADKEFLQASFGDAI